MCLISFSILALLVSQKSIINNSLISNADYVVFLMIVNAHSQIIDHIMIYLTIYGKEVFWVIALIFLFLCGKKNGKRTTILIAIIMFVLFPVGVLTKQAIERPRPIIPESDILIAADSKYAFPSGHALIASAGAAISFVSFRKTLIELTISMLLIIEAGLVCFSRIYVGAHYPLDVLGGVLLGIGISFLFVWRKKDLEIFFSIMDKLTRRFSNNS